MADSDLWDQVIQAQTQTKGDPWDEAIAQQVTPQPTPAPDEGSPWMDTAKRIAPAIVGGLVGSLAGPWGTAAGGAAGGALGSWWAGDSAGQVGLNAALGAVPAIGIAKSVAPLARVGIRALEGAGMGGVSQGASNIIEGRPLSENILPAMGMGTALGAGGGMIERALRAHAAPKLMARELEGGPTPTPATLEQAKHIAELEAKQIEYKRALDPMFDMPLAERPFKLTKEQLPQVIKLLRSDTEAAIAYVDKLRVASPDPHRVPVRTATLGAAMAGVDVPERSFFKSFISSFRTSDPVIRTTNPWVLLERGLGKESSKTIDGLGTSGSELVKRVRRTYDGFENQLSEAFEGPNGFLELVDRKLKLTPQERRNLFDAGEGAPAMNERVAEARDLIKAQQQAIEPRATKQQLMIRDPITDKQVPWTPRQDFMSHFTDWDAVSKDQGRKARAVAEIQEQESKRTGKSVSEGEAQAIFNRSRIQSRREYGHLEVSRRFSLSDIEHDGVKAHSRYMEGALKRLNEAENFGNKFEVAKNLVAGVGQDTGDDMAQYMARTYFEKVTGRTISGDEVNPVMQHVSGQVRSIQTGLKLSHAVISNMSQSVMTDMVVGHGNLVRGLRATFSKGGKQFAREAGATIEQTQRDLSGTLGRSQFASAILKYTGFSGVEVFNRMLAANSGKAFAQNLTHQLQTKGGSGLEEVKRHLRTMGIEPMDIVRQGYILTHAQELTAARSIISRTQYKVRPQELPLFWSGPWGSLVSQFSSFGFKSGKAIKDDLVKEAAHGNFKPLARLLLVAPIAGELVRDAQSIIKGKERPDNLTERLADNVAGVGTFGIFYDAYQAASHGELGISRRILGPTLSDITTVAGAVGTGNVKHLSKTALQNIPVVGSRLRTTLFPPDEPAEE